MNYSATVLLAILEIWEELPSLAGQRYAAMYLRLLEKLGRIQPAAALKREVLILDLLDFLEDIPGVWERIQVVRTTLERRRADAEELGAALPWVETPEAIDDHLHERLRPPRVVRHTDITAPGRMPVGQREAITVGLVEQAERDSLQSAKIRLQYARPVDVHLMAISPDLEILGDRVIVLDIRSAPTTPSRAVFLVRGNAPGTKDLCLEFCQQGEPILTLPFSIEVVPELTQTENQELVGGEVQTRGLEIPPADLEFRVANSSRNGATRWHFTLHSPTAALAAFYLDAHGPEIRMSPREYSEQLFAGLEELAQDSPPAGARRAQRRLRSLGESLFDDLLPDLVREFFDSLDPQQLSTVHIVSDEPWIPWELLRTTTNRSSESGFLAERFAVTRWLAGQCSSARSLEIKNAVWFEGKNTADAGPGDGRERDDLGELGRIADRSGVSLRVAYPDTLVEAEQILDDQPPPQLWHIEAPARLSSDRHDVGVQLGQEVLWPLDFDRERCSALGLGRPMVVFNVGGAGQLRWSLTRLEGWAPLWIKHCACSVFVAPICRGDAALARRFCTLLYDHLGRTSLGHAVQLTRQALQAENGDNPTWAIFTVYGHPNARISFGASHQPVP